MRRPLVLTGGPAVGKSTTARQLATQLERCAVIEVDDIRQLVVSGAVAPWREPGGTAQAQLGVRNACALARNFLAYGFEVVLTDVLTPELSEQYRYELPDCVIVHLVVEGSEALERSGRRPHWLSIDEFDLLHERDRLSPPSSDHRLRVDGLDESAQVAAVRECWS